MADFFSEKISSLKEGKNKKVISFSLYGEDVKYSLGAIRNVEFAKKHYPGWICRFYCSEEAPLLDELVEHDCEILVVDSPIPPMYWRFFAVDDPNVSIAIIRDTDSLVNAREAAAVKEWIDSNHELHTMHDCDMKGGHAMTIMGGMWGIKCPIDFDMCAEIDDFTSKKSYKFRYSDDQQFLAQRLHPIFKESCIDHHANPPNSKFKYSVPFPEHEELELGSFVGERISPFQLKKFSYSDINKDSKKLFVMLHLGPQDHIQLNPLIYKLAEKHEELIIPTKPHSNELVDYLFGGEHKIKIEKIVKDAEAIDLFEKKYGKTHRFLGLGNHGKKVKQTDFVKRCFEQAGEEYSNEFLIKSANRGSDGGSAEFNLSENQRKSIKGKISSSSKSSFSPKTDLSPLPTRKTDTSGPKVSVVIGTFNRWKFLNKTVESIREQTYKNIEIIVINDGSSDVEYDNMIKDVVWINLPKNSGEAHGFQCRSFVYNYGISIAKGEYIAFCDDDDAWYPEKLGRQMAEMKKYRSGMCCTEAYGGKGLFDKDKDYRLYNGEIFKRFSNKKFGDEFSNGIPKFWNKELLSIHNFFIGSSVVVKKEILDKVGFLNEEKRYKKGQDYELWKRVLGVTDCIYLNEPLTYYDLGHGNGREY